MGHGLRMFCRGFVIAWQMLTAIALFKHGVYKRRYTPYALLSYPLVGVILGTAAAALCYWLPFLDLYAATAAFSFYIAATGALHYDGFADTVDGIYANDAEVMKDPRIGAMGMIYTVIVLVLGYGAFVQIPPYYFPAVAGMSRFAVLLAIGGFPSVSRGMGAALQGHLRPFVWLLGGAFLLPLLMVVPFGVFMLLLAAALAGTYLAARWLQSRFGGLSGDMYGFCIVVTELILMQTILIYND